MKALVNVEELVVFLCEVFDTLSWQFSQILNLHGEFFLNVRSEI